MKQASPAAILHPLAPDRNGRDDKTRRRIVSYAANLFNERGFRKITVAEICAGMAISKRTFYKHFSGRDALVEAIVLDTFKDFVGPIMDNLNSADPAKIVIDRHFDMLLNGLLPRLSMRLFADVQTLMPETWQRIEDFRARVVVKLVELIARGQEEGTIRRDFQPEAMGHIIQGLMGSVANPSFALAHGLSLPETGRTLFAIIYRGMMPEGPSKKLKVKSKR